MNETWEQTKLRLKRTLGVSVAPEPIIETVTKPRYDEAVPEIKVALYDVKKITLPVDPHFPNGKVIITSVERQEADWWIENKLKTKVLNDTNETVVFYEKFLVGASVKERSIYSNPDRFCLEDFPDFKVPTRVD